MLWGCLTPVLLLGACGAVLGIGAAVGGDDSAPGTDDAKYTQTWSKDYKSTTCREWLQVMTPEQLFAGAADMLAGARNNGDGGSGLPTDVLIRSFRDDITTGCSTSVAADVSVAETAAGIYLIGRDTYRP